MNAISKITKIMDDPRYPEINGVTYGGIIHRFATDHAVRDYCTQVLGGYKGHACLADGSTWIPGPEYLNIGLGAVDVVQIGWNR